MNIRERIIDCIQKVGLHASKEEFLIAESISSVEFVSLLVELESEFSIEFPDYYISLDILESLDYLEKIILDLIEKGEDYIHEI